MMRGNGSRAARVLLGIALAGLPLSPVRGQNVVTPSPHFGAPMYPEMEPMGQLGLHFDRFTEFDGDTLPDGSYRLQPYNGLHQTIGLNLLAFSSTGKFKLWRRLVYRIAFQFGYTGDQPTRFFQNEVIHRVRGLRPVPVHAVRRNFPEGGFSLDVNRWAQPGRLNLPLFVGAGAAFSTINNEMFLQAGFRSPRVGPSAMARIGRIVGGDVFPSAVVARSYRAVNLSFRLPLDQWLASLPVVGGMVPEVEATVTQTTGLFVHPGGRHISEGFCAIRLTWSPVTVETWNDMCFGKDKGPTYGVRFYVRSIVFSISDWIS